MERDVVVVGQRDQEPLPPPAAVAPPRQVDDAFAELFAAGAAAQPAVRPGRRSGSTSEAWRPSEVETLFALLLQNCPANVCGKAILAELDAVSFFSLKSRVYSTF